MDWERIEQAVWREVLVRGGKGSSRLAHALVMLAGIGGEHREVAQAAARVLARRILAGTY